MPELLFFIFKYVGFFGPFFFGLLLFVALKDISEPLALFAWLICGALSMAFLIFLFTTNGNKAMSDFCYVLAGQKSRKKDLLEQVKKLVAEGMFLKVDYDAPKVWVTDAFLLLSKEEQSRRCFMSLYFYYERYELLTFGTRNDKIIIYSGKELDKSIGYYPGNKAMDWQRYETSIG